MMWQVEEAGPNCGPNINSVQLTQESRGYIKEVEHSALGEAGY